MADLQTTFVGDITAAGLSDDNKEELMIKKRFGFLPTSVWYLVKSASLCRYVEDDLGVGSYGDNGGLRLSQFNPDVAEKILRIWSNEDDKVLDPFAGRCRALIARLLNRQYVGYEISKLAYTQLQAKITRNTLFEFKYVPKLINDDSRKIAAKEEFDLVFSCPPYWDVEDYNKAYEEDVVGQLSDLHNYEEFMLAYQEIICKCYAALKQGKYCVWVVNDIRRNKQLLPFAAHTIACFEKAGFKLHDIIINQLNSLAIMGIGSAIENGYTPKMHEYILVFKKW